MTHSYAFIYVMAHRKGGDSEGAWSSGHPEPIPGFRMHCMNLVVMFSNGYGCGTPHTISELGKEVDRSIAQPALDRVRSVFFEIMYSHCCCELGVGRGSGFVHALFSRFRNSDQDPGWIFCQESVSGSISPSSFANKAPVKVGAHLSSMQYVCLFGSFIDQHELSADEI